MPQHKSHHDALDDFWTIDELLPRKRTVPPTPPQPHSTEPVELTLEPPGGQSAPDASSLTLSGTYTRVPDEADERPLVHHTIPPRDASPNRRKDTPIDTYHPENSLIHAVRIYRWPSAYTYYARFVADARRYLHVDAPPCPREPFFSYVPQYTQLTEKRLQWYLYWRSQVRQGIYLDCDYTYLLLYLYEIINLWEEIPPAEGLNALCALWTGYRATYRRLDHFLGEWICDYCLIHHLPPPTKVLDTDLEALVATSSLKEFWLDQSDTSGTAYVNALIQFAANYDYHKSKFAAGENAALYDRHIPGAMAYVVSAVAGDRTHLLSGGGLQDSMLSRDAFGGALCAHENKYRIEVDYCCFTRSHELRFLVTDIIKYTENRLRAHLGIKSRLGLYALPSTIRALIDEYLNQVLPHKQALTPAKKAEAIEEKRYAPLYEPLSTTFSPDRAAEIEQASWQTTQRLIDAFDAEEEEGLPQKPEPKREPKPVPGTAEPPAQESFSTLLHARGLAGFVCAVLNGDTEAARAEAGRIGMMPDAAVERVNEAALETYGDIFIEADERGYAVIDDYRCEAEDL